MEGRILVVDDDKAMCELIDAALTRQGFLVTTQTSAKEAVALVALRDFDVVLTDLGMHEMGGLDLVAQVLAVKPDIPVVVVTGLVTVEATIAAMRAGAFDFITKPIDADLLCLAVTHAAKHRSLREEVKRLRTAVAGERARGIIGKSPEMQRTFDFIGRVATSDASVLVHGETGTGKELVARAIHEASGRKGPFVAINCAALPASLLESELFGHARGAFTDARSSRMGLFLEAMNGTLFLDEIGELPLEVQPKLLRALQERVVRPVGSNVETPFDARLICATNKDLESEVFEKRFREDLFYRINVVNLSLPPLRERGTDVLDLAQFFLQKYKVRAGKNELELSASATEKLCAYDWQGNVRELENCMERGVALAQFDHVTVQDLPEKIRSYREDRFVVAVDKAAEILPIDELERRYILRALAIVGDNKSRTAQLLGIDRRTLYRKLRRYARGPLASVLSLSTHAERENELDPGDDTRVLAS